MSTNATAATRVLAITIAGGALYMALCAIEDGSKVRSTNHLNVDRCPYYPSPVVCHIDLRTSATAESLIPRDSSELLGPQKQPEGWR